MKHLSRLALILLTIAACGKSDPKPAAKPTEETKVEPAPAKVEPKVAPKVEPAPSKTEPLDMKADPSAPPAVVPTDEELVAKVGTDTKVDYKTETGDFVTMTVKQRVKNGKQVTDVIANDKVVETIDSGVVKDDFQMEVKSAISVTRQGVLVVVSAVKTTGKPADYYKARILNWDAAAKSMKVDRKIEFDQVYDPSKDG